MFKKLLILLSFAAAAASAKPVLTVYTYSSFNTQWGAGPGLKAAFEKVCDCEVKYVACAKRASRTAPMSSSALTTP